MQFVVRWKKLNKNKSTLLLLLLQRNPKNRKTRTKKMKMMIINNKKKVHIRWWEMHIWLALIKRNSHTDSLAQGIHELSNWNRNKSRQLWWKKIVEENNKLIKWVRKLAHSRWWWLVVGLPRCDAGDVGGGVDSLIAMINTSEMGSEVQNWLWRSSFWFGLMEHTRFPVHWKRKTGTKNT